MPFNREVMWWPLFAGLTFAAAGCAGTAPATVADRRPAVLASNGSCHDAVLDAMKIMTGSDNIRLSPDVFRTESMVLLSNYLPDELSRDGSHHFSESADRRFLLHAEKGQCLLSLVDIDQQLVATENLEACKCTSKP